MHKNVPHMINLGMKALVAKAVLVVLVVAPAVVLAILVISLMLFLDSRDAVAAVVGNAKVARSVVLI